MRFQTFWPKPILIPDEGTTAFTLPPLRGGAILWRKGGIAPKKWWKTGKGKTGKRSEPETGKWHFWVTENRKSWKYLRKTENCFWKLRKPESCFEKLRKTGKHPKDNENRRKAGKQGKKLRIAGKAKNFPWKTGNGPPITLPPLSVTMSEECDHERWCSEDFWREHQSYYCAHLKLWEKQLLLENSCFRVNNISWVNRGSGVFYKEPINTENIPCISLIMQDHDLFKLRVFLFGFIELHQTGCGR